MNSAKVAKNLDLKIIVIIKIIMYIQTSC